MRPHPEDAVRPLDHRDIAGLVGPQDVVAELAQRILDWRTEHQRFSSIDELGEVPGIGPKLLAQLRSKVRV